jgi:hypothetical protein
MPREKKDTLKSEAAEDPNTVPVSLREETLETPDVPEEKEAQVSFPVVGIGASAGGAGGL